MGKLEEALRERKIFNVHDLLVHFGGPGDVSVRYIPAQPRTVMPSKSEVYSPHFKTNPDASWYDHGRMTFIAKKSVSLPAALRWAEQTYGVKEWANFDGSKVPKHVIDKAKVFLKESS